jgi:glycogen phosphorylase
MNVTRWMASGVDVWLNTPRRYLEACGTSGMKVAFNGGINLSVLDGWWDEIYDSDIGWAIGKGEVYSDMEYQDDVESNALYDLLEKELIPSFYDRDNEDLPRFWIDRMKLSMRRLCPIFNINRMVQEYSTRMYLPAAARFEILLAEDAHKAKTLAAWKRKVRNEWNIVGVEFVEAGEKDTVRVGDDLSIRAWVNLGDLQTNEVAVQIYHGRLDTAGDINDGEVIPMLASTEKRGDACLFTGEIRYHKSGRHGFTIRVLPSHPELTSLFETRLIHWASDPVRVTA